MEKKVIVKVEDVSIKFSLASEKFDGFKEYFIQRAKKKINYQDFWAQNRAYFRREIPDVVRQRRNHPQGDPQA